MWFNSSEAAFKDFAISVTIKSAMAVISRMDMAMDIIESRLVRVNIFLTSSLFLTAWSSRSSV